MNYEDIRYEVKNQAAWITVNRPEVMNALRWQTAAELDSAFRQATEDDGVRCLVITGEGKAFSAGDDIKQVFMDPNFGERMKNFKLDQIRRESRSEFEMLIRCEKPTIAAINGIAIGTGLDMALLCDMRIAAETARLGALFVRRGVIGTVGSTYYLRQIVGLSRAYEILLTGKLIDAAEADRIGLVSRVVPGDQLLSAVEELVEELSYAAPLAQKATKRMVQRGLDSSWRVLDELTISLVDGLFQTEDHREAITAHFEKRKPEYKNR